MLLLPLVLSAHPSAWNPGTAVGERQGRDPMQDASCRFCGLLAADWQEPFHLNGDHADDAPDNIAASCVLCHLSQHLDRPSIAQEAMLVWLPEMSQAALNVLACRIHLILHRHDEPPHMERRPQTDTPALRGAWSALTALQARTAAATTRLGTASPRDLGAALLHLSPTAYVRRAELLAGVRLLPRGRYFRGGEDIYPQLLDSLPALPAGL